MRVAGANPAGSSISENRVYFHHVKDVFFRRSSFARKQKERHNKEKKDFAVP